MYLLLCIFSIYLLTPWSTANPIVSRSHNHKRDINRLEEMGITLPHLVRHIEESFPDHNTIAEEVDDPKTNLTLTKYDIPDHIWESAIESFPHEKRQENLAKRHLDLLPLGFEGPVNKKYKRFAPSGYINKRSCNNGVGRAMHNDRFDDVISFYCHNFDEYLRVLMEDGGPPPPSNTFLGVWKTGLKKDNHFEDPTTNPQPPQENVDVFFSFSGSPSFPIPVMFLKCYPALSSLKNCFFLPDDRAPGRTAGGSAGFESKQMEGGVEWSVIPGPRFQKDPFVI